MFAPLYNCFSFIPEITNFTGSGSNDKPGARIRNLINENEDDKGGEGGHCYCLIQ